MQNHKGVLIAPPRPTDYILGTDTQITPPRIVLDWSPFLSEKESQRNNVTDFLECVSMSGLHGIEMNCNYLLATNQFSEEALNFYNQYGYIVDGKFDLSARFNAKLNGTDKTQGQYLNVAGDHFRMDGFIPEYMWPITPNMTWEEFYKAVPQQLVDLGKKALWFIDPKYQWVNTVSKEILKFSPVQVATQVCFGWDSGQVVKKCSGQPVQHATLIYGIDWLGNYQDYDQYPPYLQLLAPDYELPVNMQYFVTVKPLMLRRGMIGSKVQELQEDLKKLGFLNVTKTNKTFGPVTQGAVIAFQKKFGLTQDGIVGPATFSLIESIMNTDMNVATIVRKVDTGKETIGNLTVGNFACSTLELPWKDNQQSISCIPKGTYQCEWGYMGDLKEYHYVLKDVPGRASIFIHEGNYYTNSKGCILLGSSLGDINHDGEMDVLSSRVTLAKFEALFNKKPFTLKVL